MTTYLVLTVIGDDKPGLVEKLAQIIAANSANWLESSMLQIAGKFAGILQVSVAETDADQLIEALNQLSGNLKLVIEKINAENLDESFRTLNINLIGNDRPGIIKEISRALASQGVNVEELHTECVPAPMSGETLFKARAVLKVPGELDLENLQNELEYIADDLIVEIQFS